MTEAPKPLGLSDFFALEAGEYLERLDALLGRPDAATLGEEFVRLARALRGSALMANQHALARAAQGLEQLARAVREARRVWDEGTRQTAVRGVDGLKVLLRRTSTWTEADTEKAESIGAELEQLAGRSAPAVRRSEPLALDAGSRAFVAREGAAIASTLDRCARALQQNPATRDPLQQVLRALLPLRGLAALNDLPPLPDLLEGIERATGALARQTGDAPAPSAELFATAAAAIAQAARGVAERGKPDAESAEFQHFGTLLVQFLEGGPEVVPITALYHDDAGPHVVERGTMPERGVRLGRLEMVSHGEHLRQAADSLERATSVTQRELRAHALLDTFRALAEGGGSPVADALAAFAGAAGEAVTSGQAAKHAAAFAAELRRAGDLMARSAGDDPSTLAAHLSGIGAGLRALAAGVPPEPAAEAAPATEIPPPAASHPAADIPAPRRSAATIEETTDVVGSWVAYERLSAGGTGAPSLDELFAGAHVPVDPAAAPVDEAIATSSSEHTVASQPPPVPPAPAAAPPRTSDGDVVDIRRLQYRGPQALARAQELRDEAKRSSGEHLRSLVEEVCDLVALALEPQD